MSKRNISALTAGLCLFFGFIVKGMPVLSSIDFGFALVMSIFALMPKD